MENPSTFGPSDPRRTTCIARDGVTSKQKTHLECAVGVRSWPNQEIRSAASKALTRYTAWAFVVLSSASRARYVSGVVFENPGSLGHQLRAKSEVGPAMD